MVMVVVAVVVVVVVVVVWMPPLSKSTQDLVLDERQMKNVVEACCRE